MSGKQLDGFEYLYMEVSSFSKTFLITHANQLSQACEDEILDHIWEFLNFITKLLQIKHLISMDRLIIDLTSHVYRSDYLGIWQRRVATTGAVIWLPFTIWRPTVNWLVGVSIWKLQNIIFRSDSRRSCLDRNEWRAEGEGTHQFRLFACRFCELEEGPTG